MKKLLSVVALATLVVTPALAETFTHDGVTYVYSVEQRGNMRLITGRDVTNNRPFALSVKNGWVAGDVDGNSVSFSTREVKSTKPQVTVTEVAAR